MEQTRRIKRVLYSASFYKSGAVFCGALLFLLSQTLRFIQLLQEAITRKAAGQAPPENYTVPGIIGQVLLILLVFTIFLLINGYRHNKPVLPRAKLFFALNGLTVLWGLLFFFRNIADIFVYPEFILFLDALTLASALIAPPVLLQIADSKRDLPEDNILLLLGIGGMVFTVISLLIVAVVLRKSYSFSHLLPELGFRIATGLFAIATLQKALKLRAEYPLSEPLQPKYEPETPPMVKHKQEEDWFSEFEEQTAVMRPQKAYAPESVSGENPSEATARPRKPKNAQGTSAAAQEIAHANGEEALTRWQTQRLTRPNEFEEERWQTQRLERPPITHPYDGQPVPRKSCPDCGKRMPADFPVCPRCGRNMSK
ncbi:MAG: zinc ribbon domain-containing protein [Clostridia bacterium]